MKNILFLLLLAGLQSVAQPKKSYLFIEPNVSLSFDSTLLRSGERFSNSAYGNESYNFYFRPDSLKNMKIHVEAQSARVTLTSFQTDSTLKAMFQQMLNTKSDTFTIVEASAIRHINGFSCLAFTEFNKVRKKYSSTVLAYRFFDGGLCLFNQAHPGSRFSNWALAAQILEGIQTYSRPVIREEEKSILSSYSVLVDTLANSDPFYMYTKPTYTGVVRIKEPLKHKVVEAVIMSDNSALIIPAIDDTQVHIYSADPVGPVTRKGELVLLNSFGKKVRLPFSFTYVSQGRK